MKGAVKTEHGIALRMPNGESMNFISLEHSVSSPCARTLLTYPCCRQSCDGAALGGRTKDCFDGQSFFRCGGAGGLLY